MSPGANRRLLGCLLALFVARLWIASRAGLAGDEAYYWTWARLLAAGYYDHPPMVAYGIALGRALFGDSELGVRFASVALSTAALWLLFDLARRFAGPRAGAWSVAAAVVAPLLSLGGCLATPDVPLLFFWIATLWWVARALDEGSGAAWLAAGLCLGLGGISKFSMILLAPALLAALLGMPRGRAALRTAWPYLAAGVALLVCAPFALWLRESGSDSLAHSFSKGFAVGGGKASGFPLRSLGEFIGLQALTVTPILFVLALASLLRAARAMRRASADPPRFSGDAMLPLLVYPAALPLLVFGFASLFAESYPNWAAPFYASLLVLLGRDLGVGGLAQRRRGWVTAGFAIPAAVTLYGYVAVAFPPTAWPQGPLAEVRDRAPFATWAQDLRASRGEVGLSADVLAGSYQTASLLAFYLPDRPRTDAPFERRSGSQYVLWREARERAGHGSSDHAWYFASGRRARDPERIESLFERPEEAGSFREFDGDREIKRWVAWFGPRAGSGDADAGPLDTGRWRRHTPPVPDPAADREMVERLRAIGYADGTVRAPVGGGVRIHDPERASPGLNFYTSGHAPEAVLMDMGGRVLWRWRHSFREAFPDYELPKQHLGDAHWRRAYLQPNGDVLAIFEGFGLIKVDRDSKLLWSWAGSPHHDLQQDGEGRIYLLSRGVVRRPEINPKRPVLDDFIVVLDPQGRELRRVSILEAFQRSPFAADLVRVDRNGDLFHTNSLELLDGSQSAISPAFRRGNVLISLLQMDSIAVLDLDAGTVVWSLAGGWDKQHEPTFVAPGRMLLFDNQRDRSENASRVVEFDVRTNETVWEYAGGRDGPLRSRTCGTAQRLPNGNTLVTESDNGRAFEVSPDKAIVWEYVSPHRAGEQGEFIATLFDLLRLDPDFPTDWIPDDAPHSR